MSVKNLLKSKGFSLLELSITMGLMGLVSLFTMKIMENQSMGQESVEASAEINQMVAKIAQTINHRDKCAALFKGRLVSIFPYDYQPMSGLIYDYRASPALPLTTHNLLLTRSLHNTVYKHFYIRDENDIQYAGIAPLVVNLKITFRVQPANKDQKMNLFNQNNERTIIREIPFNITYKPGSSEISSCGQVVSNSSRQAREVACASMEGIGARWNNVTGNCYLETGTCPYGEVGSGFDATGKVICTPAINQIRADDLFDTAYRTDCLMAGTQTWRLSVVGGKIRLNCSP